MLSYEVLLNLIRINKTIKSTQLRGFFFIPYLQSHYRAAKNEVGHVAI